MFQVIGVQLKDYCLMFTPTIVKHMFVDITKTRSLVDLLVYHTQMIPNNNSLSISALPFGKFKLIGSSIMINVPNSKRVAHQMALKQGLQQNQKEFQSKAKLHQEQLQVKSTIESNESKSPVQIYDEHVISLQGVCNMDVKVKDDFLFMFEFDKSRNVSYMKFQYHEQEHLVDMSQEFEAVLEKLYSLETDAKVIHQEEEGIQLFPASHPTVLPEPELKIIEEEDEQLIQKLQEQQLQQKELTVVSSEPLQPMKETVYSQEQEQEESSAIFALRFHTVEFADEVKTIMNQIKALNFFYSMKNIEYNDGIDSDEDDNTEAEISTAMKSTSTVVHRDIKFLSTTSFSGFKSWKSCANKYLSPKSSNQSDVVQLYSSTFADSYNTPNTYVARMRPVSAESNSIIECFTKNFETGTVNSIGLLPSDYSITSSSNVYIPSRVMLYNTDSELFMVNDKINNRIWQFDLAKQQITNELSLNSTFKDIFIKDILPVTKYANRENSYLLALRTDRGITCYDTRTKDGGISVDQHLSWDKKRLFNITCATTTHDGRMVAGSADGIVRFYNGVPGAVSKSNEEYKMRAKCNMASISEPFHHLDISSDGKLVVATCKQKLLVLQTTSTTNVDMFTKRVSADEKPEYFVLQLSNDHVMFAGGMKNMNFTHAYFANDDSYIVAATGNLLITWYVDTIGKSNECYTVTVTSNIINECKFAEQGEARNNAPVVSLMPDKLEVQLREEVLQEENEQQVVYTRHPIVVL